MKSRLNFEVPPTVLRGHLDELLAKDNRLSSQFRFSKSSQFTGNLWFDKNFPALKARDFLNQMVAVHPGLTWHHVPPLGPFSASTNYLYVDPNSGMKWRAISLNYDVREISSEQAKRIQSGPRVWSYCTRQVEEKGQWSIIAERRKLPMLAGLRLRNRKQYDVTCLAVELCEAVINEDVEGFLNMCDRDGVHSDGKHLTTDAITQKLKQEFLRHDYSQYVTDDFFDRASYVVEEVGEASVRIKLRRKDVMLRNTAFLDNDLWIVLHEKSPRKWVVTEISVLPSLGE